MVDSSLLEEFSPELLLLDRKSELWDLDINQEKKMNYMKRLFKEPF